MGDRLSNFLSVVYQSLGIAVIVATFLGWALRQLSKQHKTELNGLGARVNGLEITSGQHETSIDKLSRESEVASMDRKSMFKELGQISKAVEDLSKISQHRHEERNRMLTEIKVEQGKLGERVALILNNRNQNP